MRAWLLFALVALPAVALLALVSLSVSSDRASANPIGGLVAVSSGYGHTCALTTEGGVKCWGDNAYGQLGDGTRESSAVAVDVMGLPEAVTAVAAGGAHTCALLASGAVSCWGYNAVGQLGDGTTADQTLPVTVVGLESAAQIAVSGHPFGHSCAVTAGSTIKCWGKNSKRELGAETTQTCYVDPGSIPCSTTPVEVAALDADARAVTVGMDHSCALTASGGVKCWGSNKYGQLGFTPGFLPLRPGDVTGMDEGVLMLSAGGAHTCGLLESGAVKCWGANSGGELGDGTDTDSVTPVAVSGIANGSAVAAGYGHTCAIVSGRVKCWGVNAFGQLGDGGSCGIQCLAPTDTELGDTVLEISGGYRHSCAITVDENVKCWGSNYAGQLGDGTAVKRYQPVDAVEVAKPTPTPTACPPDGCVPTPTPAPQTGLDFSIGVDLDNDGIDDCSSRSGGRKQCSVPNASVASVNIYLNAFPEAVSDYEGFDLVLRYGGMRSMARSTVVWPDCGFPAYFHGDYQGMPTVAIGCNIGINRPASTFAGHLSTSEFACAGDAGVSLVHGQGNTLLLERFARPHFEARGSEERLLLTCGPPIFGDVDCSVDVTTVDVALILQYHAKLLGWLDCPQHADVNLDSDTNSTDAAVTLQYTAGLVESLPPQPSGR